MVNFNIRKTFCCSVLALLSLLVVCSSNMYASGDSWQSVQEVKVGDTAPEFTFTQDGKAMKLSDFASLYIVLSFSGSSAESSRVNADIAQLKVKFEHSDLAFINISLSENADIAGLYGVTAEPAVCIIAPDGTISSIDNGNVDLFKKLLDIFGR